MQLDEAQYKEQCREIGSLGATLPTWIRNVCRTRIDGTSPGVMDAQKAVITKRLSAYLNKYGFCDEYLNVLESTTTEKVLLIVDDIQNNMERKTILKYTGIQCRVDTSSHSPRIACMGCRIPAEIIKRIKDQKPIVSKPDKIQPKRTVKDIDKIPNTLKDLDRWVLWRYGDRGKVPYSCDGRAAKVSDSNTWDTFNNVVGKYNSDESFNGIGFVLNGDGICAVDIDGDYNYLPDTYVERSPSGVGIHIILIGSIPGERKRRGIYEIYDSLRYVTVTGDSVKQLEVSPVQKWIDNFYKLHFE